MGVGVIVGCGEVVVVGCVMVDVHAPSGQYLRGQANSHSPQSFTPPIGLPVMLLLAKGCSTRALWAVQVHRWIGHMP